MRPSERAPVITLALIGGLLSTSASGAPAFSHDEHQRRLVVRGEGVACSTCHGLEWSIAELRPAQRSHRSCDGAGCHAGDFYSAQEGMAALCAACHTDATPSRTLGGLRAFPSRDRAAQEMCIKFDHVAHLTPERRGQASADEMCARCHAGDGNRRQPPDHAACAGCHDQAGSAIPMSACEQCHESLSAINGGRGIAEPGSEGGEADTRPRALAPFESCRPWLPDHGSRIVAHFEHNSRHHRETLSGAPLSCAHCHQGAETASDPRLIRMFPGATTMRRCRACHDGSKRVPGARRRIFSTTRNCHGCHDKKALGARLRAPRDHR